MKASILALVTLVATTSLATPATAQRVSVPRIPIIRSESQDFFKQGREQFEGEIQFLTLRSYIFKQDLLKIRDFPPLEDGPFVSELPDAFTFNSKDKVLTTDAINLFGY